MGFVYLILAAIFPLTLGAGSMGGIQAKAILTGVSARTYFMTLLLAAIGAFFGYLFAYDFGSHAASSSISNNKPWLSLACPMFLQACLK